MIALLVCIVNRNLYNIHFSQLSVELSDSDCRSEKPLCRILQRINMLMPIMSININIAMINDVSLFI